MSSVGVQCLHLYEKSGTDLFQQESSVSISGGIEIVCTLFNLLQFKFFIYTVHLYMYRY